MHRLKSVGIRTAAGALLLAFFTGVCAGAAAAQEAATAPPAAGALAEVAAAEVTLERIMADPDWIGNPPEAPYWADDSQSVYYFQKQPGAEHRDLIQIDLRGQLVRTVALGERGGADAPGGDFDRERTLKVFAREGDLFVKDLASGELKQLTRTLAAESRPRVLADGRRITFLREGAVFLRELATGLELQPAELRLEKAPEEQRKEEAEKEGYLAKQQERLFGVIREQEEDEEAARQRELASRRQDPTRVPPPFYLGDGVEIRQASLSPTGDRMLVVLAKEGADEGRRDLMPNYVTRSGYVETRDVRPKVGTGEGAGQRLLLLDLVRREQHELDLAALPGITDDPLQELRAKAEAAKEGEKGEKDAGELEEEDLLPEELGEEEEAAEGEDGAEERVAGVRVVSVEPIPGAEEAVAAAQDEGKEEPKARPIQLAALLWSDSGEQAVVMGASVDNKDRWIAAIDFAAKKLVPVHRLHDPAWIGWDFNEMGWLPGSDTLWYLSEESGFSHLYLTSVDAAGEAAPRQLTAGEFEVSAVTASRDGGWLYFRANREHPGIHEIYRVAAAGGEVERLTNLGGQNHAVLAPNEASLLVLHSGVTEPPELYLQRLEPGPGGSPPAERLTRTVSDRFAAIPWVAPEIVPVPSAHAGRPVWSRLYLPAGAGPAFGPGSRPAVIFIHGAGYLQNAHHGWSDYFREFMFHTFLAQQGYAVLDMDYRASAGYGRDWRTAIYRQMGHPEVEDLADGIDYLVAEHGVDRGRVGVYGGSYGGFLTMMALFTRPELFAAGAALRPVTDWAHYNHPYTSDILNTPELDPEAYARSSPIELADGLEKPLLICAPMQDDNVLFQDVVRLAQKLIELGKEDWEVALYPIEPHGFLQPASWLDEYRRIFKLMERWVKPSSPPRPGAPGTR